MTLMMDVILSMSLDPEKDISMKFSREKFRDELYLRHNSVQATLPHISISKNGFQLFEQVASQQ